MGRIALALFLLALSMGVAAFAGEPDPLRGEAKALSTMTVFLAGMLGIFAVYRSRPRVVVN